MADSVLRVFGDGQVLSGLSQVSIGIKRTEGSLDISARSAEEWAVFLLKGGISMHIPVVDLRQTGQNILVLRERRGLSVKDLQTILGFSTPQAIYKWQHGECLPTVDNLVALSAILSVPIDAILAVDPVGCAKNEASVFVE